MRLGRFITALGVVALGGRASAATPGVLQIPFTNDAVVTLNDPGGQYGGPGQMTFAEAHSQAGMGQYGPDGPWQAVAVSLGDFASKERNPYSGVWPVISQISCLLGSQAGGNFTAQASRMVPISFRPDSSTYFTSATMTYDGQTSGASADLVTANSTVARLSAHRLLGAHASDHESVNFTAEVVALTEYHVNSLDGTTKYGTPKTGLLGMKAVLNSLTGSGCSTACTMDDFKNIGVINSRTFGLHIGTLTTLPLLRQQGSFTLGGYEQTRLAGPVGVFDVVDDHPIVLLKDLFLGYDAGHSPFTTDRTGNISLFTGRPFGDVRSAALNEKLRANQGSVVLTPSAAAPGIYLPRYLCQAISEFIPVFFDPSTGYYLWNTSNNFYKHTVNTPSYLGFVLSDRNARSITIKVAFTLLNLDLEPPLVPVRTKYFPCHPISSPAGPGDGGYFLLGRAFLQAAFFGYSLDQNVSYLAQAPGPDIDQSVVRAWRPEDISAESSLDENAWFASWWRQLPPLPYELDPETGEPKGLRGGKLDGAMLGGIIAVVIGGVVVLLLLWEMGYRLRAGKGSGKGGGAVEMGMGRGEAVEMGVEEVWEKGHDLVRVEIGDGDERHEMGSAEAKEADRTAQTETALVAKRALEDPDVFEMPGDEPLGRHCHSGGESEVDARVEAGPDETKDGTTSKGENFGEMDDVQKTRG